MPRVRIHIEAQEWLAVVDTGASHSYISNEVAAALALPIQQEHTEIRTATGTTYTEGSLLAYVEEFDTQIKFRIVPFLTAPIIIGRSDLSTLGALIDPREAIVRGPFGSLRLEYFRGTTKCSVPHVADVPAVEINTGSAKPIANRGYRIPPHVLQPLREEIDRMLHIGVIVKSQSAWASRPKIVPKPDGTIRLCGCYVDLNDVTIADRYPLPRADDVIERLQGMRYFTKLDLKSGFWQIPLQRHSWEKTAITTPFGLYEFRVLPFGLKNAPAAFQRAMDETLGELRGRICEVYVDDIVIYASSPEECVKRQNQVLDRLAAKGWRINPNKSDLIPTTSVTFLGFHLDGGTISSQDEKTRPITQIPRPRTVRQMQSFIGLCNTYRRFIQDFASIINPLRRMIKKNALAKWSEQEEEAFNEIKQRLTALPVLRLPDYTKEFVLDTDASMVGIGAVLQQADEQNNLHPVAYASRTFNDRERNWPPRELEAFAVVWAVGHFRHHLLGNHFTIRSDHESLKWMLKAERGKIARWAALLSEYEATIVYKPGTSMQHVDCLSRAMITDELEEKLIERLEVNLVEEEVADVREVTSILGRVREVISTDEEGERLKNNNILYLRQGVLWTDVGQIFVPQPMRRDLVESDHVAFNQHMGIRKTTNKLLKAYWWPGIRRDIKEQLQGCISCARAKQGPERLQGLQGRIVAHTACDIVQVDVIGPLPESEGARYILTAVDTLTKFGAAIPLVDSTAPSITRALLDGWIFHFGAPRSWLSDNASYFRATLTQGFLRKFGSDWLFSTPAHPQSHGGIEAFNRYLETQLRLLGQPQQWALHLPQALWLYNRREHATTKRSPLSLLIGREDNESNDIDVRQAHVDLNERHKELMDEREAAYQRQCTQQQESSSAANQNRHQVRINPGQWICVRLHNPTSKLDLPFSEPFQVVSCEGKRVTYATEAGDRQADVENVHVLSERVPVEADVPHEAEPELRSETQDTMENFESPRVDNEEAVEQDQQSSVATSELFQSPQESRRSLVEDPPPLAEPRKDRLRIRLVEHTHLPPIRPYKRRRWHRQRTSDNTSEGETARGRPS